MTRIIEPNTTGNFIDRLYDGFPARTHRLEQSMILDQQVKYVTVRFDEAEHETVELMMMTDLQYGHRAFKADRFNQYRDWILSKPNRFVFLGGDIIDAATKLSVGDPHDNSCAPDRQVEGVLTLLKPLAGRILGYVGGNHERRTQTTYGDSGRVIATWLKLPYSAGFQFFDIHFGKHRPFKVTMHHGTGSAQTKGAKAQMLHRLMQKGDSQVYLCGHLHDVVVLYDWRQHRAPDKTIQLQKIAGVMSSSFLDYWNTYAEVAGLAPSDTLMGRIVLDPAGGWELTLK